MTCIVAVEEDGKVYMGGDSCGSGGGHQVTMTEPKVFRRGAFVIGYTTSYRMGQLLQHSLRAPRLPDTFARDPHKFMVQTFIPAVRKCLEEGGWLVKKNEQEEAGTFLVGVRGHLFVVESDLQVGRPADGYYACGSGRTAALGSLFSTRGRTGVEERLTLALEAAEHFVTGVRRPFIVEVTR